MGQFEPSNSIQEVFFIGRNSCGAWVAQDRERLRGGLFFGQAEALRYALDENGNRRQSVVMVPEVFELEIGGASGPPTAVIREQDRAHSTALLDQGLSIQSWLQQISFEQHSPFSRAAMCG